MTSRDQLVTLGRLQSFAAATVHGEALSHLGLFLRRTLEREQYWCTPLNVGTFASTGCDGVHFSLLDLGDGLTEASPVVMTVPMAFGDDLRQNWIVGETLAELLSLGLDGDYLTLESLAYDPTWPAQIEAQRGSERPPVSQALAAELGLVPWEGGVAERLEVLHQRYSPVLQLPPRE